MHFGAVTKRQINLQQARIINLAESRKAKASQDCLFARLVERGKEGGRVGGCEIGGSSNLAAEYLIARHVGGKILATKFFSKF
jgi:hypothetical protein